VALERGDTKERRVPQSCQPDQRADPPKKAAPMITISREAIPKMPVRRNPPIRKASPATLMARRSFSSPREGPKRFMGRLSR
jgi:hypothetical protein